MTIRRGDIIIAAAPGDYGKPRPALVVQSDYFNETHASVVIALITSDQQDAPLLRIPLEPDDQNGLEGASDIMIDKLVACPSRRIRATVGRIAQAQLGEVNRLLALFLGLAEGTRQ